MRLEHFDYALPEELIAQTPAATRDGSRLLVVGENAIGHAAFPELLRFLRPGDLLVLNDTRVIRARLQGEKDTGGQAELLVERIEAPMVALCQVRVSKPLKPGRTLLLGPHRVTVLGRESMFYRLHFPVPVLEVLEVFGEIPLPPYIARAAAGEDEARYQTVYGTRPGAVAAPTAGLHFTEALLDEARGMGVEIATVTLHVGAGTFQPVRVTDLAAHRMHREHYEVTAVAAAAIAACHARGGRVVAVGTTVVRTLESAARADGAVIAGVGETTLFITPGYEFRVVDALVTNFHLPKSTLLMLVAAFGGYRRVLDAYAAAVAEGYRFFSYGDAMFLERMNDRVEDHV